MENMLLFIICLPFSRVIVWDKRKIAFLMVKMVSKCAIYHNGSNLLFLLSFFFWIFNLNKLKKFFFLFYKVAYVLFIKDLLLSKYNNLNLIERLNQAIYRRVCAWMRLNVIDRLIFNYCYWKYCYFKSFFVYKLFTFCFLNNWLFFSIKY